MENKDLDLRWITSIVKENFEVKNSKPYHKSDLVSTVSEHSIPYVTRTNFNNGLEDLVINTGKLIPNNANTIAFGAENAKFFYQPFKYITGNKMYFIENIQINKHNGVFLQLCFDNSIKSAGFGYGKGLTGTRFNNRKILLPTTPNGSPDYEYMENYSKVLFKRKEQEYLTYIQKRLHELKNITQPIPLEEKEWKAFLIDDLFKINIGKNIDGNKIDKVNGQIPYITRKESNNALDGFINFDDEFLNKVHPVITVGNETAEPFVQNFKFYTGTKVNIMKPKVSLNRNCLSFISTSLKMHKSKYSYSYTINSTRLKKQKILLPINSSGRPDYEYMEQFMKYQEYQKLKAYLDFKQENIK